MYQLLITIEQKKKKSIAKYESHIIRRLSSCNTFMEEKLIRIDIRISNQYSVINYYKYFLILFHLFDVLVFLLYYKDLLYYLLQ